MSPHREKLERLLHQTQPRLASRFHVEFKNVFGATGGYVSGRIFVSCGKFGLALKKGHVKKDYLILPETDHR
jgi:hypothetical protein